ncbi:ATP-binding protein [Rudanella lutea]|uniref:ATP-binding protein n=1 Tax=Rudanella lutea TaxID=451374 RepID=UPI0003802767|nr:ATP-binding protein [Rudanella lutea]
MDVTNSVLSGLFCALIVFWTRRFLDTQKRIPLWDKRLNLFWGLFGILVGLATAFKSELPVVLLWICSIPTLSYTAWLLRDLQPARTLFQGLLPYVFVIVNAKIVEAVAPGFYKRHDDIFDLVSSVMTVWLAASFIFASRQKKEWARIEAERAEEAERRRLDEVRKAELEHLVAERTAEISRQKEELEQTLAELKATQDQLVQREKLASLGELTAGIAHEIQNPLNFVNNFSEVSAELVKELIDERQRGPERDEGLEAELLDDLTQNLQKIAHHGHRASGIIRSMLQHSRASTGQREAVDINALADEYLKLSYHGLRAKDKTFNAKFEALTDPAVGTVSVIPQDIGRVLLNLYNNAFYATQQRVKQGTPGYQPTVTVLTERVGDRVRIRVRDNGLGMPDSVRQKIFQPFFTTKPTGEGTGLGLSLSYDIITKGHGGTLTVDSQEGEGTEFVVELPN